MGARRLMASLWLAALCLVTTAAGFSTDDAELDTFDPDSFLEDDEIGEGSCSPEALPAANLTECRYPLTGSGWEPYGGPLSLVASASNIVKYHSKKFVT